MDRNGIREYLRKLFSQAIGEDVGALSDDCAIMDEIDLNSLQLMTAVADIENDMNMRFSDEELMSIVTVGDIVDILAAKTEKP